MIFFDTDKLIFIDYDYLLPDDLSFYLGIFFLIMKHFFEIFIISMYIWHLESSDVQTVFSAS